MKRFFLILIVTFVVALVPTIFLDFDTSYLVKPPLFPSKLVFPIAWSIFYILMSISLYLCTKKDDDLYKIYIIQLLVNTIWSPLFFGLKLYFLALIWIILLLILVIIMMYKMYHKNKIAFFLQIPYLLWVVFATYLTLGIYLLN